MNLFSKTYYALKPFLPRGLRMAFRRGRAHSRRIAYRGIWPIDERAGVPPPGWPGWPEGKRFAFVLTHDVEGSNGLPRVEQLMKLELAHGFRSSFNFVPEGDYRVPDELRQTLEQSGFEIGVHGLEHDGKLYDSKAEFASKAVRIRDYLQRWKAAGFRSPLMQHRLSWLHQLDVEYDTSTFDTDPFEPQPDGVGTVFPFWVPSQNDAGYVELPYTLPQDFTLFVVLREQNIDIWKQKLDWLAEHGGMALLTVHPDYMSFDGKRTAYEYPVSHYEELLRYVHQKYEGAFWHALPREVSRFYTASLLPGARNSRKKICMLAYTNYESDNRVRRYAEALVKRGDHVDVIAISGENTPLGEEEISGVRVYRIQRREHIERGKWTYAWPLLRFLVASSIFLARRHREVLYDLIHVHNVPDFLVFAAWYPKWTGAKVILDIHDIVPELFASKFRAKGQAHYVKLLKSIEKASAAFADHVIISNHLWEQKLISRSVPKEKCSVFLNHVDSGVFSRRIRTRDDGRYIILFPGTFQWHQGIDLAIEALAHLKDKVPHAELHLYGGGGGGAMQADLAGLAQRLGLNGRVKFCGSVPMDQIPDIIANADLGIVPKRADSFGNEAYSTKIMEFMSQGVPVVVSRTKIDQFYFNDTVVRFFESGNALALAEAMLQIIEDRALRDALVAKGYEYVARYGWDTRRRDYLNLIDSLSVETFG